jgi:hypothetical protein
MVSGEAKAQHGLAKFPDTRMGISWYGIGIIEVLHKYRYGIIPGCRERRERNLQSATRASV